MIQIDLTINYKIINKLNKWKLPVIKKNLDTCIKQFEDFQKLNMNKQIRQYKAYIREVE